MNDQSVLQHRSYSLKNDVCFISFTQMSYGQAEKIYHWRNHPEVRKWMYNQAPIQMEDHFRYLAQLNNQHQTFYWLVGDKGKPLGVIKLNCEGRYSGEWGFYLNPDYMGSGMGVNLVYHAINFFFNKLDIKSLYGYVRVENREALKLHDLFGISEDIMEEMETDCGKDWFYRRSLSKEEWNDRNWDLMDVKRLLLKKPVKIAKEG